MSTDNKPLSKEEILKKQKDAWLYIDNNIVDGSIGGIYDAMDEWAKQEAIGFYIWAVIRAFSLNEKETLSTEELYTLYLQSKK